MSKVVAEELRYQNNWKALYYMIIKTGFRRKPLENYFYFSE